MSITLTVFITINFHAFGLPNTYSADKKLLKFRYFLIYTHIFQQYFKTALYSFYKISRSIFDIFLLCCIKPLSLFKAYPNR